MPSVPVMSLLVCIVPLSAELTPEHHLSFAPLEVYAEATAKLVDKMLNRVVEASPLHHTAVDETTLGKPGNLVVPSNRLGTRHIPSLGTKAMKNSGPFVSQQVPQGGASRGEVKPQRWVGLGAGQRDIQPKAKLDQVETLAEPTRSIPTKRRGTALSKTFAVAKPLGLMLGDVSGGIGAKVVYVEPHGNAANALIDSGMRLVSINGQRCKEALFDDIMTSLRGLKLSEPIQLEMESKAAKVTEVVSNPEPLSVRVDGGDVVFEVRMTLDPKDAARALRWKTAKSMEGRQVMKVESVDMDSEAFRLGMRPGMIVKTLGGGSGRSESEEWKMDKLRAINKQNFLDSIRLARYPITFTMLEGVKLGAEDDKRLISREGRRIAAAYTRQMELTREVDKDKDGMFRSKLAWFGVSYGLIIVPPAVILALNHAYGWTANGPTYY